MSPEGNRLRHFRQHRGILCTHGLRLTEFAKILQHRFHLIISVYSILSKVGWTSKPDV